MISNSIKAKWWQIDKNIKKNIVAKYDRIKDWVIDPKGYFLIDVDHKENLIRVGYCKFVNLKKNENHEMISQITGTSAISIVNTIIRLEYISSLQHAADMGLELQKAEIALKNNIQYIQDQKINYR